MELTKEDLIKARKLQIDSDKCLKEFQVSYKELMSKDYFPDDTARYTITLHLLASLICECGKSFSTIFSDTDFLIFMSRIVAAHHSEGGCSTCHECDKEFTEDDDEREEEEEDNDLPSPEDIIKALVTMIQEKRKKK